MTTITIRKLDHAGNESFRYEGVVVARGTAWVQIEARFGRPDVDTGYVVFRTGDRLVEWFYADRWYNIFELHDVSDDRLKGWYCNITRPALLSETEIAWPDLALDVWITPSGELSVVDQDEFEVLALDATVRQAAWDAVDDLRRRVGSGEPPFALIK